MKRKIAVLALTAFLAVSFAGCQPESPPEESSEAESSVITELNGITVKSPVKPYFAKLEDFQDKAEPFDSEFAEGEDTRLKKATSALTADNVHYEFTEYGIAENMLGSEVDVITVEIERKGNTTYNKTTKRIVDGSTYVSYDKFTIPITIPTNATKKLVFIMYPKLKDTEYYIKAIFFSPKEIYTNWNYSVVLDSKKNYQRKFKRKKLEKF